MASMEQILRDLQQQVSFAAARAREAGEKIGQMSGQNAVIQQEQRRQERDIQNLADAMASVKVSSNGGGNVPQSEHIRYIENIPGRRIPFDLVCTIPIGATSLGEVQGTKTISQDGPFVAVARSIVFQSAYTFQRVDPVTQAQALFQGRSFGRFRPASSVWDLNDSGGLLQPTAGIAAPGTGAPLVASPSNHSGFRTMEWDGLITLQNQGSGWPRANDPVPSAFWSTDINAPFQLGAMDFFERGETIQYRVIPTHLNNPPAGNLSGYAAGGLYPFLASQYDVHEGISDPLNPAATADPIRRLPEGFLTLLLHGFRILQPPGPVRLT